jgi:hypothetical protein
MLRALSIYQIISSAASILMFAMTNIFSKNSFSGSLAYLAAATILALNAYIIYLNAGYLSRPKQNSHFRSVNMWFNFLQLFQLSLFGLAFSFVDGLSFTPHFSLYTQGSYWGIVVHIFVVSFNCSYHPNNDDIAAGLNLIPAAYMILFHYYRHSDETPETLDLFTQPSPPPQDFHKPYPPKT